MKRIYVLTILCFSLFATSCGNVSGVETDLKVNEVTGPYEGVVINFADESVTQGKENFVRDEDENVVIKSGETYILKGTLNGKRIKVEKDKSDEVRIVLSNFTLSSDIDCPIYSPDNKCKVSIVLDDGSDNVINLHKGTKESTLNENAAIFANGDLSFEGAGQLAINTDSESSIECKNNLTFISGVYALKTKGDGIRASDKLVVKGGHFEITSGDDAIKATSAKNGQFYLENGEINILANDKGITSDNELYIAGGQILIDSKGESLSGKAVNILGGVTYLKSDDDCINATDTKQDKKANQQGVYVKISGGEINIDAKMDGIDSNGDLYFEGGRTIVIGSTNDNERIIDYNGKVVLKKGTEMFGVGPAAKMQDFGDKPEQNYIVVYANDDTKVGNVFKLIDSTGNVILDYSLKDSYNAALISSPKFVNGETYTIITGGKEYTVNMRDGRNVVE